MTGSTSDLRPGRRTMVGIWAHPDDEAYLSAGLMAEMRRAGHRVVVITATLGERGTDDPASWPPTRLAARRRVELRNSLAAVGVDDVRLLGYEDGTCDRQDGAVATARIARLLAEVRPDLVVTFGPDGVTGHPDHRAVNVWATEAWARACPTAELWYPTFTPEFHRTWGELNDRIGLWGDQPEPPTTDPDGLVHGSRLPDELLERKLGALEAHRSQTGPLIELVGRDTYREWWRHESFRRAEVTALAGRPGRERAPERRVA